MIPLSLLLVLTSLGLLVWGLLASAQAFVWGSVVSSLAAVACLLASVRHRRVHTVADDTAPAGDALAMPVDLGGTLAVAVRPQAEVPASPAAPPDEAASQARAAGQPTDPVAQPLTLPDEPPVEDISVPDALRVAQLDLPVLVVDGRPRYHLEGCRHLAGRPSVPLAVALARRTGFTPCALCHPDATLLARSRTGASAGPPGAAGPASGPA